MSGTAREIHPNVFVLDPPLQGQAHEDVTRVCAFSAGRLGTVLQPVDRNGSVLFIEPVGSGRDAAHALALRGYEIHTRRRSGR